MARPNQQMVLVVSMIGILLVFSVFMFVLIKIFGQSTAAQERKYSKPFEQQAERKRKANQDEDDMPFAGFNPLKSNSMRESDIKKSHGDDFESY